MLNRIFPTLALFLLLITGHTQNQVTDSSATCVAYWKKGDVKHFTINKSTTTIEGRKSPVSNNFSCEAMITILDESATSYKIQWQYKLSSSKEPFQDSTFSQLEVFNRLLNNLKIIYTTSETGSYDSLVNYAEVKKFVSTSLNELMKLGKYNTPEYQKAMNQLRPIMESRITIEALFLKDISNFHAPYGVEYSNKQPDILESELPNVFGGEPFPATLSLSLLKLETAKNTATIGIKQTIDVEKAAEILKEIMVKLAAATDIDAKDGIEKAGINSVNINDDYRYDLSLSDGWIKKAVFTRTIAIHDMKKIETTQILVK